MLPQCWLALAAGFHSSCGPLRGRCFQHHGSSGERGAGIGQVKMSQSLFLLRFQLFSPKYSSNGCKPSVNFQSSAKFILTIFVSVLVALTKGQVFGDSYCASLEVLVTFVAQAIVHCILFCP